MKTDGKLDEELQFANDKTYLLPSNVELRGIIEELGLDVVKTTTYLLQDDIRIQQLICFRRPFQMQGHSRSKNVEYEIAL